VVINTSRGEILNEKDVIDHLNANKDFMVGLDVYQNEPNNNKGAFES